MAESSWFRMNEWTAANAAGFELRLGRAKPGSRPQYLRIQAFHLADAGLHAESLELLGRCIALDDRSQTAAAHLQRAQSLLALGRETEAIEAFRLCLAYERAFPFVLTQCGLLFPWYVANAGLRDLYDEALQALATRTNLLFPMERFRAATVRAFVADDRGDPYAARAFAEVALREARADSTGLPFHPRLGLVGDGVTPEVIARLRRLAV